MLTQFDQARAAGRALPVGYWARGEDRWTSREAEDGHVPGDAVWVQPPIEESGPESPFERQLRAGRADSSWTGSAGCGGQ